MVQGSDVSYDCVGVSYILLGTGCYRICSLHGESVATDLDNTR